MSISRDGNFNINPEPTKTNNGIINPENNLLPPNLPFWDLTRIPQLDRVVTPTVPRGLSPAINVDPKSPKTGDSVLNIILFHL